jgi:hypothetical protein
MARLVIKSDGFGSQILELKLGVNRLGRAPQNDFQINHETISSVHCEVSLDDGHILVRDCRSTNGTFFRGEPITEARLSAGQSFQAGDVEILVETTDANVAIPKFDVPRPAPPIVMPDGSIICRRHPRAQATHRCTHCRELLCETCVHRLRRRGGKVLKLCPLCSHPCELIGGEKKKKKSLLGFLQKTVKLPFVHSSKNTD